MFQYYFINLHGYLYTNCNAFSTTSKMWWHLFLYLHVNGSIYKQWTTR